MPGIGDDFVEFRTWFTDPSKLVGHKPNRVPTTQSGYLSRSFGAFHEELVLLPRAVSDWMCRCCYAVDSDRATLTPPVLVNL